MNSPVVFETGPFAVTQEVRQAAWKFLGIDKQCALTQIKKIGPNHVQIIQFESLGQKNPFESTDFIPSTIIAEFIGILQGNRILWRQNNCL